MKKVKAHGMGDQVLNWIKASLTIKKELKLIVKILTRVAKMSGVCCGVILGPLLFII